MKRILFYLFSWLTIPHILSYIFCSNKKIIRKDVTRWCRCDNLNCNSFFFSLVWLLLFKKEYRNLFYLRIGKARHLLMFILPPYQLFIFVQNQRMLVQGYTFNMAFQL